MQSRSRNREKEKVLEYGRNGKNKEMTQQEGKFKIVRIEISKGKYFGQEEAAGKWEEQRRR